MELSERLNFLDRIKAELDAQRPLPEEVTRKINTKLRLDWNYHSNAIEGNTLSYGETKALLLHDRYIGNHEGRFYREILGHDSVIKDLILNVSDLVKEQSYPLTQSLIRDLHKSMLVDEYYSEAITPDGQPTAKKIVPGQYKTLPNSVRKSNGEMFFYTEPTDVEFEMNSLLETYRTNPEGLHPVAMAAYFHYRFIRIHPFDDGNGRLSRILMNLLLFRAGFVPAIIPVPERSRYIEILGTVDATNNLAPFVAYIAEKVQHTMEMELKAARGEDISDPGDGDKMLNLVIKKIFEENADFKPKRDLNLTEVVLFKTVFPFFEIMEKRCRKFSALAQEVIISFYVSPLPLGDLKSFKHASDAKFIYCPEYYANNNHEARRDLINRTKSIRMVLELNGFKRKNYETRKYETSLIFDFNEYGYGLQTLLGNHTFADLGYNEHPDIDAYAERCFIEIMEGVSKLIEIEI